jgi:hypothetical protein
MSEHEAEAVEDFADEPGGDSENETANSRHVADLDALPVGVRDALGSLDGLSDLELTEHVERYQHIHSGLQTALSDIEGV